MSLTKANNPLRLVYDALWAMLREDTDFQTMFPAAHCVEYGGTMNMEPDRHGVLAPADFPQCAVRLESMAPAIQNTSNSSFLHTVWSIEVLTGDRQQTTLMDAMWIIYKATTNWVEELRDATAIKWQSKSFVHCCKPMEVSIDDATKATNRGTRGWTCLWRGRVDMNFTSTDLDT